MAPDKPSGKRAKSGKKSLGKSSFRGDDQTNKMCRGHKLASLKWADESGVPLRGRVILSTINCCMYDMLTDSFYSDKEVL